MISPFHFINVRWRFCLIMFIIILGCQLFLKVNVGILKVLLFINLLGILPIRWSLSSYFWSNILLSIILWSVVSISKIFFFNKTFLSHLLPTGSPISLWLFLIILETVSHIIRPLTLSLRLTCNIISGHVLLSLSCSTNRLIISLFVIAFEFCVCVIQSLVFLILLRSYKDE